jgi:hypothetical protein
LHVTLTGLRGLVAPVLAVLAYHGLRRLGGGLESGSMLLPAAIITLGAWQFTVLRGELAGPAAGRVHADRGGGDSGTMGR